MPLLPYPPFAPQGALRIAALLDVGGCAAPAGGLWPRCRAALGFLLRPGRRPCRYTRALGLHLSLCGCCSLLQKLRNVMLGAPASRPAPSAALRVGLRPSLDTRPAALAPRRKEGPPTKLQRASRSTAGQSRSASFTSPYKGGSPGKLRCALPVTYPAGKARQGKDFLSQKDPREAWTSLGRSTTLRDTGGIMSRYPIPAQDPALTIIVGWDNPVCREA